MTCQLDIVRLDMQIGRLGWTEFTQMFKYDLFVGNSSRRCANMTPRLNLVHSYVK